MVSESDKQQNKPDGCATGSCTVVCSLYVCTALTTASTHGDTRNICCNGNKPLNSSGTLWSFILILKFQTTLSQPNYSMPPALPHLQLPGKGRSAQVIHPKKLILKVVITLNFIRVNFQLICTSNWRPAGRLLYFEIASADPRRIPEINSLFCFKYFIFVLECIHLDNIINANVIYYSIICVNNQMKSNYILKVHLRKLN